MGDDELLNTLTKLTEALKDLRAESMIQHQILSVVLAKIAGDAANPDEYLKAISLAMDEFISKLATHPVYGLEAGATLIGKKDRLISEARLSFGKG